MKNALQTKPERVEKGFHPSPENQNAEKQPVPNHFLRLSALIVLLVLLAANLFSFWQLNLLNSRLEALKHERQELVLAHQKKLNYYTGLRKSSNTIPLIKKYSKEYGVNPSFVSAIISRESHFDPSAVSSVGARGLMQIMKNTGEWMATKLKTENYSYDSLFDPELNIRFGSYYLAYLSDQFSGNPIMVASAYHAGANNVKLWALNYAQDQKNLTLDQIPKDNTKDYVRKVMDAYAVYFEADQKQVSSTSVSGS